MQVKGTGSLEDANIDTGSISGAGAGAGSPSFEIWCCHLPNRYPRIQVLFGPQI